MKYIRRFETGTGGSDPRSKWIAVYKCGACNNEEWIPMGNPQTFRTMDRVCPKCLALEPEDRRKSLEERRAQLEAEHIRIQAEIEKVISELEGMPVEDSKEA